MRLLKYEIYKIITKKLFWGMLVAALGVNVLALWFLNRPSQNEFTNAEVKEVFDTLRTLPMREKLVWLDDELDLLNAHQNKQWLLDALSWSRESNRGGFSHDDWMREYIEGLEAQYEADRERFGDRMDEDIDLSWEVIGIRRGFFNSIINDLTVNTYSAYLDRIDAEAQILLGSAIFGGDPDSFSSRNIRATQEAFEALRGVEIRYDVNAGITALFNSPSADIIILLLLVTICLILITDEKDKRLFLIVKSTPKGHIHTILAKLGALAVSVTFVSILVFFSGVIFAEITFGLGDVSRSMQSVPMFFGSTLQLSVMGFMVLDLVLKTFALICAGMVVMLIAIHAKHSIILMLATVVLAAANVALSAIPMISSFNLLRFLNLYSLIRPHRIFGDYFNLNFFGNPLRLTPVFIIFSVIIFALFAVLICISYLKKHTLESNLNLFKFKRFKLPAKVHTGYKFYEFKKLAFTNKAVLILVVFGIIQGYTIYDQHEPPLGFWHRFEKEQLLSLEGPLTQEKHEFIMSERRRLDEAHDEIALLDQRQWNGDITWFEYWELARPHHETINSMQGFEEVFGRFQYVRETNHAQFVYDAGYARLFGMSNPNAGLIPGMWLIGIMILCLSGIFPMEYKTGMYKILNASPRGHADTVRLKLLLAGGTVLAAFIIASIPDLVYTARFYGFGVIGAGASSIPPAEFGTIPAFMGWMPLWLYIGFILLLRLLFFAGIAFIILAISLKVRNNAYAILVSAGILLFPLFMYLFGLNLFNPVSTLELIKTNGLIVAPSALKALKVIVFAIISAGSGWYVIKRFGKT
jgi:hypothetical protein